ncbi:hypothetical protein ACFWAY_43110 [Rhodococcus sp. NPDC059968]|uniref:hypothetical protein n=1 Tax=Rhodococcus sp. NPDC059968 TaxID=3347017 RepID=UPI00366A95B3
MAIPLRGWVDGVEHSTADHEDKLWCMTGQTSPIAGAGAMCRSQAAADAGSLDAVRLAWQAAISRVVAGLLPSPQRGQRMVTVRAISSTMTVNGAEHLRHQRCRVTELT